MEIDTDRIDEAVLALLYLGLHDRYRAWKGFDWAALDRLHKKGLISDPVSQAESVVFTEEGLGAAGRCRGGPTRGGGAGPGGCWPRCVGPAAERTGAIPKAVPRGSAHG